MKSIILQSALLLALLSTACQHNQTGPAGEQATAAAQIFPKYANDKDFICNMKVTPDFTDTCLHKGKVYAFCSGSCKESFLENPEKYLSATTTDQ